MKWNKIVDGVLGIRTRVGRMVGADESTEQWRHPSMKIVKKMCQTPPICFLFFSNTIFTGKTVGLSGIRIWIVEVEGKHADHLTTTTALAWKLFAFIFYPRHWVHYQK